MKPLRRKLIIEILLVPESEDKESREIEDEILREFNERHLIVPWSDVIERVKVLETR